MSFIRIDKPAGGPSDALDQALAMARERLEHQYSTPNARIGPAASLIRDFSEVAAAGASVEACAAAVFVRKLTSRLSEDELENIRDRVGQRTADIVALTHDCRWDGPTLAQRVWCRVKRIHRRGDAEARLVVERVALREADKLARNHERLEPQTVAELASALRVIAESSEVDQSVAASVAELLASSGLVGVRWRRALRHDDADPRVLPVGYCRSDDYRPYLTWHRDLAALAEAMLPEAGDVLTGDELIDRRRRLHLTAQPGGQDAYQTPMHDLSSLISVRGPASGSEPLSSCAMTTTSSFETSARGTGMRIPRTPRSQTGFSTTSSRQSNNMATREPNAPNPRL